MGRIWSGPQTRHTNPWCHRDWKSKGWALRELRVRGKLTGESNPTTVRRNDLISRFFWILLLGPVPLMLSMKPVFVPYLKAVLPTTSPWRLLRLPANVQSTSKAQWRGHEESSLSSLPEPLQLRVMVAVIRRSLASSCLHPRIFHKSTRVTLLHCKLQIPQCGPCLNPPLASLPLW